MSGNLQSTDLDEWDEIGEEVHRVSEDVTKLISKLNSVPKTEWQDEHERADRAMNELQNVLEERMFKEHGDDASTKTFYRN